MIPKEAFFALCALSAVSMAFGYTMRGLVEGAKKDCTEDDMDADHDRWEDDPEPTVIRKDTCDTCRYQKVKWYDEPCLSCAHSDDTNNWEAKDEIHKNSDD